MTRLSYPALAPWLVVALLALQLMGTTFDAPFVVTPAFVLLFVGIAATTAPSGNPPSRVLRVIGALLAIVGINLFGGAWMSRVFPGSVTLHPAVQEFLTTPVWNHQRQLIWLLAGVIPLGLGLNWLLARRAEHRGLERAGLFVALAFWALHLTNFRYQRLLIAPSTPEFATHKWTVLAVLVVLFLSTFTRRVPSFVRFAVLVLVLALYRGLSLKVAQPNPDVRDMLPLAEAAQNVFWSGENPYGVYRLQARADVPLTYLPGLWGGFGVPRLFGLDLRWWGVLADVCVTFGAWVLAAQGNARRRSLMRGCAFVFAAGWLSSPAVHWNGIYAEPHAWWGVLALLLVATLRRKWRLAAVLLGVALATRHFAIVVAPFVIIAWWRGVGLRRAASLTGLAGLVAAALLLPFAVSDPEAFWFGTLRWLTGYGAAHAGWFRLKLGFTGHAYAHGWAEWLPHAQVATLVLGVGLAVWRRRWALRIGAVTYVAFICFNSIIWDSFYLGALVFVVLATLGEGGFEKSKQLKEPRVIAFAARRGRGVAGLVAALLCGIVFFLTLLGVRDESRRTQAVAAVTAALKPGSAAVVDRSVRQLAFVRREPIVRPALGASVGPTEFSPRHGAVDAFSRPTIISVAHRARRDAQFDALRSPRAGARDVGVWRVPGDDGAAACPA